MTVGDLFSSIEGESFGLQNAFWPWFVIVSFDAACHMILLHRHGQGFH